MKVNIKEKEISTLALQFHSNIPSDCKECTLKQSAGTGIFSEAVFLVKGSNCFLSIYMRPIIFIWNIFQEKKEILGKDSNHSASPKLCVQNKVRYFISKCTKWLLQKSTLLCGTTIYIKFSLGFIFWKNLFLGGGSYCGINLLFLGSFGWRRPYWRSWAHPIFTHTL